MLLKKIKKTPQDELVNNRKLTAQKWMPIADIENGNVYKKDNTILGMLRVQPINIDLLSDNEHRRLIDVLTEALNGVSEGLQIFCIGRPVDLNNYLDWLQEKARNETDFTRKMLLKELIKQSSYIASSGEMTERRFYIIASAKYTGTKSINDLSIMLKELQSKLAKANLVSSICNDDEILDVYALFSNPIQAAYERYEISHDLPPILFLKEGLNNG